MMEQMRARNRAERRAAGRGKGRRAAGAVLTAGSAALAMSAGVLGSIPAAHAAGTYTVTQSADDGSGGTSGSLSWAIDQANGDPGSTIDFSITGSLSINGTMPHVTAPVTITGPGASALTIDGNNAHRVFYIESAASNVTISGLTFANAYTDGANFDGGAILSRAGLDVSASTFTDNVAGSDAGAIFFDADGAALRIDNSTFSGNSNQDNDGGAVAVGDASSVSISSSTFTGNVAEEAGGALYLDTSGAPATITGSTFTGNHSGTAPDSYDADEAAGGAIFDSDSNHTLTITGSTISGNVAEARGGGGVMMYSDGGGASADIEDSVVSNNRAMYSGGGLYFYGVSGATILRTTISGNTASIGERGTGGGGIFVGSAFDGQFEIGESTVSGNQGASGGGMWFYSDSPVHVFNSTISGNTATGDEGGGVTLLYVNGFYATQSTVTDNHAAAGTVGGLYLAGAQGGSASAHAASRAKKGARAAGAPDRDPDVEARSVHPSRTRAQGLFEAGLVSTIVSANSGEDVGGATATVHSNHSLLGTNGAAITVDDQGATIRTSTPGVGPLQGNGGPTQTHALLAGSAAIDAGLVPVPPFTGSEFDQRGDGFARVVNGIVDIGAYEVQPEPEPVTPTPQALVITPKFTG